MTMLGSYYELLTAIAEPWQPWREQANCRGLSPELFFGGKGEPTGRARAVCHECEVQQECLKYALTHTERFGLWGGASERERKKLRRNIPRPKAQHGTVSRYNHGCHCEECRTAYAAYRRERRVREVQTNIVELRTQRNRRGRAG